MTEVARNAPPPFVLDVCACLEAVLSPTTCALEVEVQPEALRRLRTGRGKPEDEEMVIPSQVQKVAYIFVLNCLFEYRLSRW